MKRSKNSTSADSGERVDDAITDERRVAEWPATELRREQGGHGVVTIIVGIVDSSEGRSALERGIEEARLRGAPLVVVHSSRGGHDDREEDVIAWRERLEEIDRRLTDDGIAHEIREFVRGNSPADDILQAAADERADLIVVGLRRRSPVGKLLLGSTAQEVLLSADCAVLAVKPPRDQPSG
jgi:nucleotide-binding universal stress UspA family protein